MSVVLQQPKPKPKVANHSDDDEVVVASPVVIPLASAPPLAVPVVPYAAPADTLVVAPTVEIAPQPVVLQMTIHEWLKAHGLEAYLDKLKAEDISELSHFQDLTDDDVQALVDKWQMPIRTRRNFLVALDALKQALVKPPSYDEPPPLETKVGTLDTQLADYVEREDDKAIVNTMMAQAKVETVQTKCIDSLLVLARSDVNKTSLVENDAHLAIINAMKTHVRSPVLLEIAIGALWHIVLFADSENGVYIYRDHANDKNKEMLVEQGVAGLVVAALRAHPTAAKLARNSCGLLWSLATIESNKDRLLEMSAHVSVLDAMKAHPTDPYVQANGCGFLWSLASGKSAHAPLQASGAREAAAAALRTLPSSKQVQKFATLALKKLP